MGDNGPLSWLCVALLVVVNYIRIVAIDDKLKESVCHGISTYHGSSHRKLGANQYGCVDYVLPYAIFSASMLCLCFQIISLLTNFYYDHLISKCLEWDNVAKASDRSSYLEFLRQSAFHEKIYKKLTQHSLFEYAIGEAKIDSNDQPKRALSFGIRSKNIDSSPLDIDNDDCSEIIAAPRMSSRTSLPVQGSYRREGNRRVSLGEKIKELKSLGDTLAHISDLHREVLTDVMSVDEYKCEIDFIKAKLEHDEELLNTAPFFHRLRVSFMNFFHSLYQKRKNFPLPSGISSKPSERPKLSSSTRRLNQSRRNSTESRQRRETTDDVKDQNDTVTIESSKDWEENPKRSIYFKSRPSPIDEHFRESEHSQMSEYIQPEQSPSNSTKKVQIINDIFFLRCPSLHFALVEISLLLQCFYISVWFTQLLPMAIHSHHMVLFIVLSGAPILYNTFLVKSILHQTVMLQCATALHPDVVVNVCDETIQEATVLYNIQRSLREKCQKISDDRSTWYAFIRTEFKKHDLNGDGGMDMMEFRNFLGSIGIYMSKARFDIVWEAVDLDLSGSISWDELFVLVFPEYQSDITDELELMEELRNRIKQSLTDQNIAKSRWIKTLFKIFHEFDVDGSDSLDEGEFTAYLESLGLHYDSTIYRRLFLATDTEYDGKISFSEFCNILNLHVDESNGHGTLSGKCDDDVSSVSSHSNKNTTLAVLGKSICHALTNSVHATISPSHSVDHISGMISNTPNERSYSVLTMEESFQYNNSETIKLSGGNTSFCDRDMRDGLFSQTFSILIDEESNDGTTTSRKLHVEPI